MITISAIRMNNWLFMSLLTLSCCFSSCCIGLLFINQLPILLGASLGQNWKKGVAEERLMLFTMVPLGCAIFGSIISSKCIKKGRRGPKMMFDIVGIIGCSLAISNSYFLMLIGKCILAVAAGA